LLGFIAVLEQPKYSLEDLKYSVFTRVSWKNGTDGAAARQAGAGKLWFVDFCASTFGDISKPARPPLQ
jgi:hypothetical protein